MSDRKNSKKKSEPLERAAGGAVEVEERRPVSVDETDEGLTATGNNDQSRTDAPDATTETMAEGAPPAPLTDEEPAHDGEAASDKAQADELGASADAEAQLEDLPEIVESDEPIAPIGDPQQAVTEDEPIPVAEHEAEAVAAAAATGQGEEVGEPTETKAEAVGLNAEAAPTQPQDDEPAELTSIPSPPEPGPANPSPDGTQLAFLQASDEGRVDLWFYSVEGTRAWTIDLPFSPLIDEAGPQWSPDGTQLALTGRRPGSFETMIWIVPAEGGTCRSLSDHPGSDHSPRWSPDGAWIAFISERDGRAGLVVMSADGDAPPVALTYGVPGQDEREPVWSEDGARIGFLRRTIEGDQAGDHIWTVSLTTGEVKQITKKLANRNSLRWCPGKAQMACISDEGDWLNVAVVNPDNSAGWNLASEAGDKGDPHYSPDGTRILYTRTAKGEVRLCERATSGAAAEPIDQGMGLVSSPRWLPEKRVVYRFAPATGAPAFVMQETSKEAERTAMPAPVAWEPETSFVEPVHVEYELSSGSKLGGLFYKSSSWTSPIPAVVYLGPDPTQQNVARFQPVEQALATAGFAVYAPTLPGSPGYGKKLVNAHKENVVPEAEINDLLEIVNMVRSLDAVDGRMVAVVGWGYGGAMALLVAGGRPRSVDAVVAIDPITDWDVEYNAGNASWRTWQATQLGLPASNRGPYALRTPETFAGVIGSPLLLIETDGAPRGRREQLEQLIETLNETGVSFERQQAEPEPAWRTGRRAARFIREVFGPNAKPAAPEEEPETEPVEGEAMRTDAI